MVRSVLLLLALVPSASAASRGGGVTSLVAGTNVTLTPTTGVGQVTVAATGSGVAANSTSTISGTWTFASTTSIGAEPFTFVESNKNDGLTINIGYRSIYAKSIDGANQSSGCVVAVGMSGTGPSANLTFTSTTTANMDLAATGQIFPGILLETCAPSTFCHIGISGVYRVRGDNNSYTPLTGQGPNFAGTRCRVVAAASANYILSQAVGRYISISDAQGFIWMKVGL